MHVEPVEDTIKHFIDPHGKIHFVAELQGAQYEHSKKIEHNEVK